jgi:hypothetical protein
MFMFNLSLVYGQLVSISLMVDGNLRVTMKAKIKQQSEFTI